MYRMYTDGACKGNPGYGGWAYLLIHPDGRRTEACGSQAHTTNNRMELQAIVEGLGAIPPQIPKAEVTIVTDSTYAIKCASLQIRPTTKNIDLVERLQHLLSLVDPTFRHVKGHSGHTENEYVDKLASKAARNGIRSVGKMTS